MNCGYAVSSALCYRNNIEHVQLRTRKIFRKKQNLIKCPKPHNGGTKHNRYVAHNSVEEIHSVGTINNVETSYFTQLKMCYLMTTDVRNKHFVASSIKDLFDTTEAHKIIDFIKETRFYNNVCYFFFL